MVTEQRQAANKISVAPVWSKTHKWGHRWIGAFLKPLGGSGGPSPQGAPRPGTGPPRSCGAAAGRAAGAPLGTTPLGTTLSRPGSGACVHRIPRETHQAATIRPRHFPNYFSSWDRWGSPGVDTFLDRICPESVLLLPVGAPRFAAAVMLAGGHWPLQGRDSRVPRDFATLPTLGP